MANTTEDSPTTNPPTTTTVDTPVDTPEENIATEPSYPREWNEPNNWSAHARAWFLIGRMPPELSLTNHTRTDAILTKIYEFGAIVPEAEKMATNLFRVRKDQEEVETTRKTLHRDMMEAKELVKLRSNQLAGLQATALRSPNAQGGSLANLDEERRTAQVAIGFGVQLLLQAGVTYSDAVAKHNKCNKAFKENEKILKFALTDGLEATTLMNNVLLRRRLCLEKMQHIITAMSMETQDISNWGPSSATEEHFASLEQCFNIEVPAPSS